MNIDLPKTIDSITKWEAMLADYTIDQLLMTPASDSRSLGQVYMHLIGSTETFHCASALTASQSDTDKTKGKAFPGYLVYWIFRGFPPMKIKVPPSPDYTPAQPESIEQIRDGIARVCLAVRETADAITASDLGGKVAHPAFGYLDATEWFGMIEMHWRHHVRQKRRVDIIIG